MAGLRIAGLGFLLLVLGVLMPWYVWRIKVYTQRNNELFKRWFAMEQRRRDESMRVPPT